MNPFYVDLIYLLTSINIYANWTQVSRIFSLFQLCIGWGEGELQENFEKDAPFYRSLCIDPPPSLRFSRWGGGGGGGVCTQAILWGRPEITESYEYYHEYRNYEYFPKDFCLGL